MRNTCVFRCIGVFLLCSSTPSRWGCGNKAKNAQWSPQPTVTKPLLPQKGTGTGTRNRNRNRTEKSTFCICYVMPIDCSQVFLSGLTQEHPKNTRGEQQKAREWSVPANLTLGTGTRDTGTGTPSARGYSSCGPLRSKISLFLVANSFVPSGTTIPATSTCNTSVFPLGTQRNTEEQKEHRNT